MPYGDNGGIQRRGCWHQGYKGANKNQWSLKGLFCKGVQGGGRLAALQEGLKTKEGGKGKNGINIQINGKKQEEKETWKTGIGVKGGGKEQWRP
jgi:hypothetical protein